MRSYRDLCGIARALDAVGERWALLVVRELVFGPKRFSDLHRGLPGMSQNVLTQRLRELEESDVLRRRGTLPPAAGLVYELTDHGRGLEPVLLALGRWGSPLPPDPGSAMELSADALVVALRTTFDPAVARITRGTVQLRLPSDAFLLTVGDGRLAAVRGHGPADATLTCDVRTVQDLVFAGRALEHAVRRGDAYVEGDVELLRRLLGAFDDRPASSCPRAAGR
ncbi:transcriptional regulator, HxlR family [Beutenbergia cavernae DSM 12333]|uniref:Transcriptional regulator, HxlR family n=1 Tax=Beutenbergia cavernae (strain ATCC BAA-8 / DSM 12333 / CCUG 43141 / JCM 11478 / NBRC 16432 / NCIMB 13614 / HKI 0122) TaxID=471853 RepID=C5C6D0_BEUC1|nr:winged helix-turn-helix transcriptional regulator [Beutenbergia cavernae]ACQ80336.1 transcriptional regulator, HxlR family [Beutenbergia cavernae DSM 12333]